MSDELQAALPREMYVDAAHWAVERDAVLYGEWYCVGRVDDLGLATPKRAVAVDVAGESVLVTSAEDGTLHAAYNVCRHRGSQLCPPEAAGAGRRLAALPLPLVDLRARRLAAQVAARDGRRPGRVRAAPGRRGDLAGVRLRPPHSCVGGSARRAGRASGRGAAQLRHRRPGDRAGAALRRRRQLQGAARELQRVLPLRPGAPGAVAAGAVVRRRRLANSTGTTASRTARARGRSR